MSKSFQFWKATDENDLALLQELSRDPSVDFNFVHQSGYTPLAVACRKGKVDLVKFLLRIPGLDPNFSFRGDTSALLVAVRKQRIQVVEVLLGNPRVEVNGESSHTAPLNCACEIGDVEMAKVLLSCPRLKVNGRDQRSTTPLLDACEYGQVEIVQLLLDDPRVDANKGSHSMSFGQNTLPVMMASFKGHLEVVQLLLASRGVVKVSDPLQLQVLRELRFSTKQREIDHKKIMDLLERYQKDRKGTRASLIPKEKAGGLFALVVYLSDGYLKIAAGQFGDTEKQRKAKRFFQMAARLPMDMQMELCNRVFGVEGSIIKKDHSERGFKHHARWMDAEQK